MATNDKNTRDGKKAIALLERYLRMESVDKLTVATTFVIVLCVMFALGTSAVFFLCNGLVKTLSQLIGSESYAYYAVGAFLFALMWIFWSNKKKWVEARMVESLSSSILEAQFTQPRRMSRLAREIAEELEAEEELEATDL